MATSHATPHTREAVGLRQGSQDDKMRELAEARREAFPSTEFNLGLVHHHDGLAFEFAQEELDVRQWHIVARRVVGGTEENEFDARAGGVAGSGNDSRQVQRIARVAQQGHVHDGRALDTGSDGVHAEGRWALQNGVLPRRAEHANQQVDGFVAAATSNETLRWHAVQFRQPRLEGQRVWLGIAVQASSGSVCRIAPRVFVGMLTRYRQVSGFMF